MLSNTPVLRQMYSAFCGEISVLFCTLETAGVCIRLIWDFIPPGNLLTMSFGATIGWAVVNFVDLQQDDTKFPSGPLSLLQATRVMSLFFASAVIGNLMFPYIVKKIGCKTTMFILGFPQMVSWIEYKSRAKRVSKQRCVSFSHSDQLVVDHIRPKSILSVRVAHCGWPGLCRSDGVYAAVRHRHLQWRVSNGANEMAASGD